MLVSSLSLPMCTIRPAGLPGARHQPQHRLDRVVDVAERPELVGARAPGTGPRRACARSDISGITWSAPIRGPYTLWNRPTTAAKPLARAACRKAASPSSLLIAYANRGAVDVGDHDRHVLRGGHRHDAGVDAAGVHLAGGGEEDPLARRHPVEQVQRGERVDPDHAGRVPLHVAHARRRRPAGRSGPSRAAAPAQVAGSVRSPETTVDRRVRAQLGQVGVVAARGRSRRRWSPSCPSATSRRARCRPMKPAPPSSRAFMPRVSVAVARGR